MTCSRVFLRLFGCFVVLMQTTVVMTSRAFVTPGDPACYVSLSGNEYVSGYLFTQCPSSNDTVRSACGNGQSYYLYCSNDHECCFQDNCPACCTKRNTLNKAEVTGVVIACTVVALVLLVVSYFLAGKFCKLKPSA